MKEENCQHEKSILKRKLSESAIDIERQVGSVNLNQLKFPDILPYN